MSESTNKPKTNALFAWQETKMGLGVIAFLDFFLAYIFVSLAIDTGSLIQYFIALVFFALAVGHAVKLFKKVRKRD